MRKFCARWWVVDPWERYRRATAEEFNERYGISVRYLHHATPEDVRFEVYARFLCMPDMFATPVECSDYEDECPSP